MILVGLFQLRIFHDPLLEAEQNCCSLSICSCSQPLSPALPVLTQATNPTLHLYSQRKVLGTALSFSTSPHPLSPQFGVTPGIIWSNSSPLTPL